MENSRMIALETFCRYYEVEEKFIVTVQDEGLIQIVTIENNRFIPEETLSDLERIIRLHRELEINPEGIGAVLQLLEKIETLQEENQYLKRKLKRLEF